MSLLPDFAQMKSYPKSPLKGLFTAASSDAIDLLAKMIIFDPLKRINAKDVNNANMAINRRHFLISISKIYRDRPNAKSFQKLI